MLKLVSPADSVPQLRHLDLSDNISGYYPNPNWGAELMRLICARTRLRDLRLSHCDATAEAEFASRLTAGALAQMQHLVLSVRSPSAAFVASLAKVTGLSALSLGTAKIRAMGQRER